jgi:hypothetical protein
MRRQGADLSSLEQSRAPTKDGLREGHQKLPSDSASIDALFEHAGLVYEPHVEPFPEVLEPEFMVGIF